MIDAKRPQPLYPRTLLSWLVSSVAIATLCVLGLSIAVFVLASAVHDLAGQREADHRAAVRQAHAAVRQSNAEIREIDRLRRLVKAQGGNPGPRKFRPTTTGGTSTGGGVTRETAAPAPAPNPAPTPRPSSRPSSRPTHKPTPRPTHKPTPPAHSPTPHPVRSCLTHPIKCLPVTQAVSYHRRVVVAFNPPAEPDPIRQFLRHREPDNPVVNAFRLIVVIFGASYTGWVAGRWRRIGATCREGKAMHLALVTIWLAIWLTEAEQIGLGWLPWRLPLAVVAIPLTLWFEWVHTQLHHQGPSVSDRFRVLFGRTLRRSAE